MMCSMLRSSSITTPQAGLGLLFEQAGLGLPFEQAGLGVPFDQAGLGVPFDQAGRGCAVFGNLTLLRVGHPWPAAGTR